jgi:DNA-binding NarL/FixJ family response regulator
MRRTCRIVLTSRSKPNGNIMIIDISLPKISRLALTRKVREQYPAIKIIIVTGHEESRYYERSERFGPICIHQHPFHAKAFLSSQVVH